VPGVGYYRSAHEAALFVAQDFYSGVWRVVDLASNLLKKSP